MASEPDQLEALASALDLILPPAFIHDTRRNEDMMATLAPEEQAMAAEMNGSRRAEFTTARLMIRELMKVISPNQKEKNPPVLNDKDGAVIWPPSVTGSISHTKGICSVVVTSQKKSSTRVGIDIETRGRLSEESKRRISSKSEQARVEAWASSQQLSLQDAYTIVFSAKEAFFKYQFPTTRIWLEFQDVEVLSIDIEHLELSAVKLEGYELPANRRAYFRLTENHAVTAVWS